VTELLNNKSKTSSFQNKKNDPGFLVAKGRFYSSYEESHSKLFQEREQLLVEGKAGDSIEVVDLTRKINELQSSINRDRRYLEKDHVKSLANAIFMAMSNNGYANIRAVGRNANYNAIKAIAISEGYCKTKGIDICFDICFDEGNLGELRSQHHVKTVTAMMFRLKNYREWVDIKKRKKNESNVFE